MDKETQKTIIMKLIDIQRNDLVMLFTKYIETNDKSYLKEIKEVIGENYFINSLNEPKGFRCFNCSKELIYDNPDKDKNIDCHYPYKNSNFLIRICKDNCCTGSPCICDGKLGRSVACCKDCYGVFEEKIRKIQERFPKYSVNECCRKTWEFVDCTIWD
jgi:hypothetical protein